MRRNKADTGQQLRDEQLLDMLTSSDMSGESVPPDGTDPLATALLAWRDDLNTDIPAAPVDLEELLPATPAGAGWQRWRRRLIAAGAALALAGGGGAVAAAATAGPGSPLWPITQLVYPDQAESRTSQQQAEDLVVQARQAATDDRYDDAARLLDDAEHLLPEVSDAVRDQLRDEIGQVRQLLHDLAAAAEDDGTLLPELTDEIGEGESGLLPGGSEDEPVESTSSPDPSDPVVDDDDEDDDGGDGGDDKDDGSLLPPLLPPILP
jgi:hypothetical protein